MAQQFGKRVGVGVDAASIQQPRSTKENIQIVASAIAIIAMGALIWSLFPTAEERAEAASARADKAAYVEREAAAAREAAANDPVAVSLKWSLYTVQRHCAEQIRTQLNHPETFKLMSGTGDRHVDRASGIWTVRFGFTAMNGPGLHAPARAHCTVTRRSMVTARFEQ